MFVMVCFVLGGASRADVIQQAVIRPIALIFCTILVCFAPRIDWWSIRWPGFLLIALATLIALQLVPLPFMLWSALPGREMAVQVVEQLGRTGDWYSLSLTPDRTLNSLFSLSVPAAMLVAMASLDERDRRLMLLAIIFAVVINMLLGFLQLVQGRFYIYSITNLGSAVGFFANRNHNAALIAATLPLLGCLATWPVHKPATRQMLYTIATGLLVLSLLAILAIGSRWGLALGAVGFVSTIMVAWRDIKGLFQRQPKVVRFVFMGAVALLVLGMIAIAVFGARDESLRRLFQMDLSQDTRAQTLPVTFELLRDMLPLGSGFGSFETMYKTVEPRGLLSFQYLNHVHNDYIELIIETGIPGLALLLVALGWVAMRIGRSFSRANFRESIDGRLARAAGALAVIAMLASIPDYPVRTPIWMLVLAACAVWLEGIGRRDVGEMDGSSERTHANPARQLRS